MMGVGGISTVRQSDLSEANLIPLSSGANSDRRHVHAPGAPGQAAHAMSHMEVPRSTPDPCCLVTKDT